MDCLAPRISVRFLCKKCFAYATSSKSRRLFSSSRRPTTSEESQKLYEDLGRRIAEFKTQLIRNNRASFLSRSASNSLFNLNKALVDMKEKEKKLDGPSLIASVPACMSLEVLSNGTAQIGPCLIIRTPYKIYMFNCPEGISRFMVSLRLKPNNLNDIFLTRAAWDNFGGISSILLLKQEGGDITRIHGTIDVRRFFECIRPFADADCPSVKFPAQVEERSLEMGSYSDPAVSVQYLPMIPSSSSSCGTVPLPQSSLGTILRTDVSYLVELTNPPRRINAAKLIELGIPNGPVIAKLKDGYDVTLDDGRVIKPDDVLFADNIGEQPSALIADCSGLSYLPSLRENSLLQGYMRKEKSLTYCVHFTPKEVFETPEYSEWMTSFGELCTHIVLNGSGPTLPHIESIHRNQALLRRIAPMFYPQLKPDYTGVITQDDECEKVGNVFFARPLQRFSLRGKMSNLDPNLITLTEESIMQPANATEEAKAAIKEFQKVAGELRNGSNVVMPVLNFLGTSSAVPSKYRNVSGYLLQISEFSYILVDCGEGSYGQIRALFGDEKSSEVLVNLNAIFITHAHQDHMNGLYTVILRRQEAFDKKGLEYRPLVLVCNSNIIKPLKLYSRCFSNLEPLVSFVNTYRRLEPSTEHAPRQKRDRFHPNDFTNMVLDVTEMLPKDLYDESKWGLRKATVVQVHHTRMANGFIFELTDGNKVVFSGDTKPCDLLVEHGLGADVLVHESTFEDGHERDALFKKHSTMRQAVDVGARMKAKNIVLSHFSARYPKVPPLPGYLDELGNISIAMDNLSVCFEDLQMLPKLLPVFRQLYQEELFDIQMRLEQRQLRKEEDENSRVQRRKSELREGRSRDLKADRAAGAPELKRKAKVGITM